jgi:hypothetical protein
MSQTFIDIMAQYGYNTVRLAPADTWLGHQCVSYIPNFPGLRRNRRRRPGEVKIGELL